ncbi:MAG: FAD-dependent oxidoreductase, partial [Gammaproteobacteria bacterium]
MSAIEHYCDVLIIGSGAAGMTLALKLSDQRQVMMLCKDDPTEGATYYAQGGVAAVLDEYDSVRSHIDDTLVAGAGLCHEDVVEFTVSHSAETVNWLVEMGVNFDMHNRSDGTEEFHLTREGGHSHRRVIHAADATGREIAEALGQRVSEQDNVKVMPRYVAVDLITRDKVGLRGKDVIGIYALNLQTQQVELFRANFVVLATGGASKVYLYTSNPDTASGDGIAMAWRAGCRVA